MVASRNVDCFFLRLLFVYCGNIFFLLCSVLFCFVIFLGQSMQLMVDFFRKLVNMFFLRFSTFETDEKKH